MVDVKLHIRVKYIQTPKDIRILRQVKFINYII